MDSNDTGIPYLDLEKGRPFFAFIPTGTKHIIGNLPSSSRQLHQDNFNHKVTTADPVYLLLHISVNTPLKYKNHCLDSLRRSNQAWLILAQVYWTLCQSRGPQTYNVHIAKHCEHFHHYLLFLLSSYLVTITMNVVNKLE